MTGYTIVLLVALLTILSIVSWVWISRIPRGKRHPDPDRHIRALRRKYAGEDKRYSTIAIMVVTILAAILVAAPATGALEWFLEHGESILLIAVFPGILIGLMQKLEGAEVPYWLSFWAAVCSFFYGIFTLF